MWIKQLIHTISTRRKLALWLKRQRAVRLEVACLSDHVKKDIGLNNLSATPLLQWQQAPNTKLTDLKGSLTSNPNRSKG
ncbi:MAG: hypothetical protein WD601_08255 [Pseudohongiellaceae bacterium]